MEPQSCLFLQSKRQGRRNCNILVVQDLNIKLTTLQEQSNTVQNSMQTSEEIAQAYEQKNKVRMKSILQIPNSLLL